jgi:hypothetical protein
MPYCDTWLRTVAEPQTGLLVLGEKDGARANVLSQLCDSVAEHLVGTDILAVLGFPKSSAAIRNRLPTSKQIRSGDLGEIIATDYVHEKSQFKVPLRRLRYKDDRNTSMRGDDLIALDTTVSPVRVLKAEVKSRATLAAAAVRLACTALEANRGRPKASSLAFISMRLRERGEDEIAALIEGLQEGELRLDQVHHLVFTVSGNAPLNHLESCLNDPVTAAERRLIGLHVENHQDFVHGIFNSLDARYT